MMRKASWMIPLLFLLRAVGAPCTQAQTYIYTYTSTDSVAGFTFTTVPIPAAGLNDLLTADISTYSLTGSDLAGGTLSGVVLDLDVEVSPGVYSPGGTYIDTTTYSVTNPDDFNSSDYDTPGTYTSDFGTMTVSVSPEPGTAILWLTGIGLMIVTRKRIAHLLRLGTGAHVSLSPH